MPFGQVDPNLLSAFETTIGASLPKSYRRFLEEKNGGEFERNIIKDIGLRVHHLYGLHDGPESLRLQSKWQAHNYYDLDHLKNHFFGRIVFGDCSTGELLLLDIKSGAVELLDQELFADERLYSKTELPLQFLSDDFGNFVKGLISDEESLLELPEQERLDFERRLADFKREAKERNP